MLVAILISVVSVLLFFVVLPLLSFSTMKMKEGSIDKCRKWVAIRKGEIISITEKYHSLTVSYTYETKWRDAKGEHLMIFNADPLNNWFKEIDKVSETQKEHVTDFTDTV